MIPRRQALHLRLPPAPGTRQSPCPVLCHSACVLSSQIQQSPHIPQPFNQGHARKAPEKTQFDGLVNAINSGAVSHWVNCILYNIPEDIFQDYRRHSQENSVGSPPMSQTADIHYQMLPHEVKHIIRPENHRHPSRRITSWIPLPVTSLHNFRDTGRHPTMPWHRSGPHILFYGSTPSWRLLPQVIHKLRSEPCQAIIIAPTCYTAEFFWLQNHAESYLLLPDEPLYRRGPGFAALPAPPWRTTAFLFRNAPPACGRGRRGEPGTGKARNLHG